MRKFLQEFKEFAMRGNVMDLAVGVIIGAAFQTIINSLVNDIIMPLIGLIGKVDFSQKVFVLRGVDIRYGAFLTAILNFVIMAFAIFLLVKAMNALSNLGRKKDEPEVPTTKVCPYCCSKITLKATRCPHCTSILEEPENTK